MRFLSSEVERLREVTSDLESKKDEMDSTKIYLNNVAGQFEGMLSDLQSVGERATNVTNIPPVLPSQIMTGGETSSVHGSSALQTRSDINAVKDYTASAFMQERQFAESRDQELLARLDALQAGIDRLETAGKHQMNKLDQVFHKLAEDLGKPKEDIIPRLDLLQVTLEASTRLTHHEYEATSANIADLKTLSKTYLIRVKFRTLLPTTKA